MDIRNHGIASRNLSTERLYNGIKLPDVWPPRNVDPMTDDVIKVPYLLSEEEGEYILKIHKHYKKQCLFLCIFTKDTL